MVLENAEICVSHQGHAITRDRGLYGSTRQSVSLPSGPAIATASALFTFIDDSNYAEDPARADVTGADRGAFSFTNFLLSMHSRENRVIKELSVFECQSSDFGEYCHGGELSCTWGFSIRH